MASLPRLHPSLSLHLADRALTTLISSASPAAAPTSARQAAASSAPEGLQLEALQALTTSALGLHDAAGRLGLGAPQRILVEYGHGGPLLIETFLDPAASATSGATSSGDAAADPARHQALTPPSLSSPASTPAPTTTEESFSTSGSQVAVATRRVGTQGRPPEDGTVEELVNGIRRLGQAAAATAPRGARPAGHSSDADDDATGDGRGSATPRIDAGTSGVEVAPMLVGIVLAASAEDGGEARRAMARLERIGRDIQGQWAAADGGGGAAN